MKTFFASVITVATLVSTVFAGTAHAAGSATLTVSGGATVTKGNNVTVSIVANGTDMNVVTAKLTFDASKLACGAIGGSSAFPNQVSASCNNGAVTISRYANPGTTVSGAQTVGTITFSTIATGSAAVSTAAGSQIAAAGVNTWNGAISTTSFTINNPVVVEPEKPVVNPTKPETTQPTSGQAPTTNTGEVKNPSVAAATATTNNGSVASENTTTEATTDDAKDDNKKADDTKKTDAENANSSVSAGWFWLLAILAVIGGVIAGRRVQAARLAKIAAVAPAAKAKPATPAKKTAKTKK